ncbi:class II aldolase/adducin family protein [Candidatus Methylocalor cossyra]|uniref:Ribulose-5-phosphate 4-epimerase/Fuculose-1-phosphate aldolase n=1 Tax=Candidatus Methylocalor cossyra TaxID=3108543 RepID=A0ABP1C780_9GAMM
MTLATPPQDREGVIQYRLDFTPAPAPPWSLVADLDAWRQLLFRLGLTGRDPNRYGGLAYGNVSLRIGARRFLISGTQTGGIERLRAEHYGWVTGFDIEHNLIVAQGPIRPSSEALTHAAAYRAARRVRCVLHVHAPELWSSAERLGIPMTHPEFGYGTAALAEAVGALLRRSEVNVIAMGGHRDGLLAVGGTPETAAEALLRHLAAALRCASASP